MKPLNPAEVLTGKALRRLRLRHIELLQMLSEATTVRATAAQLNLSQPAVSKMIGEIEEVVGLRLFIRGRRGIWANAQGQLLIRHAGFMINQLQAASDEIDAMRLGASGLLRVGSFQTSTLVPRAITQLRQKLPGLLVRLHDSRPPQLLAQLLAGELDCVVTAIHPDVLTMPGVDTLQLQSVATDRVCVIAAPSHPLVQAKKLTWSDVTSQRWVLPPPDALTRRVLVMACMKRGLPPPVPAVESNAFNTLRYLVRFDSTLLGLTRHHLAQEDNDLGLLRILPLTPALPLPDISLITRRDDVVEPSLMAALHQALRRSHKHSKPR